MVIFFGENSKELSIFLSRLEFFDLPKTAPGNNFHQINRRNLLILAQDSMGEMKRIADKIKSQIVFIIIFTLSQKRECKDKHLI